jgi:hypothetical protein
MMAFALPKDVYPYLISAVERSTNASDHAAVVDRRSFGQVQLRREGQPHSLLTKATLPCVL